MLNPASIVHREYSFIPSAPLSKNKVTVKLPDLGGLKYDVWGDWGPMYDYKLTSNSSVQIEIQGKVIHSKQATLRIESPIFAYERDQTPYYIVVESPEHALAFYLYISPRGDLLRVKAQGMEESFTFFDKPVGSDVAYVS